MEGQCQCGAVKFTTPGEKPLRVFICHCLECRRQSSSAYGVTVVFPKFELPEHLVGTYTWTSPVGNIKHGVFCRKCGSRITHAHDGSKFVAVKGGCLDGLNAEMMGSATHIWTKQALVPIPEEAEQYEGDPPPPR